MPSPAQFKQHVKHGWTKQSTDHIKNVAALKTHFFMRCPCGWIGWVEKGKINV